MSDPRCKPGQLAFVKKALRKENVGKIVTCIKYVGYYSQGDVIEISGERFLAYDTDHYWIIKANALETQFGPSREAYTMDSWLQPIEPLNDEDLIETKELEEA
jgi:hypothetical protein